MISNKDIINCLPLIASVLGRRYGVTVHVGGDTAYTDGKDIYLPSLPQDSDTRTINLARGYIDHESAHIRHTNFKILKQSKLTELEKHIWNIIEDWRVEKTLSEHYPGCKGNFTWLIKELFLKTPQTTGIPVVSLLNWLLLTVRSWNVQELQTICDQEAQTIEKHFPGLHAVLLTEMDLTKAHCPDTADALGHARRIVELLKHHIPNQNDTGSEPSPLRQLVEADAQTIKSMAPAPVGEILSEQLSGGKAIREDTALAVASVGHVLLLPLPTDHAQASGQACRILKTKLHGLLQARTLKRCLPGRRGKVDGSLLHRSSVQNPRVFMQAAERQGLNTAVHLLLDKSGSMQGRIDLACAACHALVSALMAVPGINVGLTLFPAHPQKATHSVAPLIRHGERHHLPPFTTQASMSTPLTEALWWTIQQMLPLKESRKIIFIVTDGEPDSPTSAKYALGKARSLGMEVMGLGICTTAMDALLLVSKNINNIHMLPDTMFTMLRQALIHKGDI